MLLVIALVLCAIQVRAQTFQVLHNFTGGRDGANPYDGLTMDGNGNLYGTASAGGIQGYGYHNSYGTQGCGAVFQLAHAGSGWILSQIVIDSAGNLYGTTAVGGAYGYGVVWEITS